MVEIKFKDYTVITDEDGSIHDVLFKEDSKPMLMLGSGRFIHHMLAEIVRLRGLLDAAQPAIAQSDCIWARNGNAVCPAKVKGGA